VVDMDRMVWIVAVALALDKLGFATELVGVVLEVAVVSVLWVVDKEAAAHDSPFESSLLPPPHLFLSRSFSASLLSSETAGSRNSGEAF
jgi:hypothetical protein